MFCVCWLIWASVQELARAQGWPDESDFSGLSPAQLGGALGNAWPLAVSAKLVQAHLSSHTPLSFSFHVWPVAGPGKAAPLEVTTATAAMGEK